MKLCNAELVKIEKFYRRYLYWTSNEPTFLITIRKANVDITFEVMGELRSAVKYSTDKYLLLYLTNVFCIDGKEDIDRTFSSLINGYIVVDRRTGDICAGIIFRDEASDFLDELFRELGA